MFNPSVTISIYLCYLQILLIEDEKKIASFKFFAKLFIGLLEDIKETELQNIIALFFRISFRTYILEYVLGYFFFLFCKARVIYVYI